MDTRAQWEEEKLVVEELLAAYTAPISALRLPKVRKADGVQEIGNPLEDQPIQELDSQLDNHDREVACGLCMCRLLPVGRHGATKYKGHCIASRESAGCVLRDVLALAGCTQLFSRNTTIPCRPRKRIRKHSQMKSFIAG